MLKHYCFFNNIGNNSSKKFQKSFCSASQSLNSSNLFGKQGNKSLKKMKTSFQSFSSKIYNKTPSCSKDLENNMIQLKFIKVLLMDFPPFDLFYQLSILLATCEFGMHLIPFFPQKQPPEVFCKKGVLRNFIKLTGKHLCQSLLFEKSLQSSGDCFYQKSITILF